MKKLICIIPFASLLFACQPQPGSDSSSLQAKQEANVAFITEYFEHFNNHEWEKMAAMYIDSAEFKDPSLGPGSVIQTQVQTIIKYTHLNSIFADLHDEVIKMYPSGEQHVIVEFISSGTSPYSSRFELPICTIFTIEKGQITRDYTYYDNFEE